MFGLVVLSGMKWNDKNYITSISKNLTSLFNLYHQAKHKWIMFGHVIIVTVLRNATTLFATICHAATIMFDIRWYYINFQIRCLILYSTRYIFYCRFYWRLLFAFLRINFKSSQAKKKNERISWRNSIPCQLFSENKSLAYKRLLKFIMENDLQFWKWTANFATAADTKTQTSQDNVTLWCENSFEMTFC